MPANTKVAFPGLKQQHWTCSHDAFQWISKQKMTPFHICRVSVNLRFIDEHFLGSGWLPDVPDADEGAAVKQHVAV